MNGRVKTFQQFVVPEPELPVGKIDAAMCNRLLVTASVIFMHAFIVFKCCEFIVL